MCLKPYDSESFHPLNNTAPPNVVSGEEESSSHLVPLRGRETKTERERVQEGINSFTGKDMCFSLDYAEHVFKNCDFKVKKKCSYNKKRRFLLYKKGRKQALFLRLLFVLVEGLQVKMWTPFVPFPQTGSRSVQFANRLGTGLLFHGLERHVITSLLYVCLRLCLPSGLRVPTTTTPNMTSV